MAAEACISCICKRVYRDARIRPCEREKARHNWIWLPTTMSFYVERFWVYYFSCEVLETMATCEWINGFSPPVGRSEALQLRNATFPSCARVLTGLQMSCARTQRKDDDSGGIEAKDRSQPGYQPASSQRFVAVPQRGDPVNLCRVHDKFRR